MRLLQKYPWLIPIDGEEWVPVEATPIVEAIGREQEGNGKWGSDVPIRPPWPRCAIEFTTPYGVRARFLALIEERPDIPMEEDLLSEGSITSAFSAARKYGGVVGKFRISSMISIARGPL